MEVKISNDPIPVISINGRMDTGNTAIFEEAIAPVLKSDTKELIIDGTGLEYISSSGLRQFLVLQKNIKEKGGSLTVKSLRAEIKDIFDLTGFTNIFTII
ncbi:MAG: STAS domain-containing protein [Bacteroidales bacterium]|jgi:anti-anti-sigma factor|nr:STAS domain-containing protein [Bacteroidales bacterium]MDD2823900.1 STAS domain-containing protein [Bacteroidales bacterium]MDD3100942.1 STAS domain-containing protein [Bacteroidales bacterium]MDD3639867.1 STAS domain-containing protein [Bacteroidales bacterium]MDD3944574.1 STAS domain-containing protein [Bacteroidales bacterium]